MLEAEQNRVAVVLVRARNPSNIGAVARAMHDLGFRDLRVVNEFPVPFAAAKSAVDASSVLENAAEFGEIAEAVADCSLVLGTTAVGERALEHPLHRLPQAAELVRSSLQDRAAKVALLFGSEKTGLSNDELSHCHALVTIPMNTRGTDRHLSMNLGQAVAICLYALTQATTVPDALQLHRDAWDATAAANAGDVERLTSLLRDVLATSGYARRNPGNSREANIRRLVRRMAVTGADAQVWMGILRQVLYVTDAQRRAKDPGLSSHEEPDSDIAGQTAPKM